MTISLVLLVAALILFIVAAVGIPSGRINLMAAGLACWVAAQLATGIK